MIVNYSEDDCTLQKSNQLLVILNLGKPAILLNCHLPIIVNKLKRSG